MSAQKGRPVWFAFLVMANLAFAVNITGTQGSSAPVLQSGAVPVPVGALLEIRLQAPINSGTAKPDQRFEATLLLDYMQKDIVVLPAGATVLGFVSSVRPGDRLEHRGSLTLAFEELRMEARTVRLRATIVAALDPKVRDDISRLGTGVNAGGLVAGFQVGGGQEALVGVAITGGGTMTPTDGANVALPLGTVLRIRIDQPLQVIVR